MHAIDGPGSIAGKFTAGNPAIGQDATAVTADWLNDVQGNLLAVLVEGAVPATKGRSADLLDALKVIIKGVQGGEQQGVPTARKLIGGGLVTIDGNGDFTSDRTVTVKRASAEQVSAGKADDVVITPLALRQSAAAGLEPNGYAKLPGGLIIQWGAARGSYAEGPAYMPFAIAFPNACFSVTVTAANLSGGRTRDIWAQLVDRGVAGFTTMLQLGGGGTQNSIDGFDYIAIGW